MTADVDRDDMDALHILPLSVIPLQTAGLHRARLIKNAQMQGVVELFRGQGSGSGQISPQHLDRVFAFTPETRGDFDTIKALSQLPSYDVYSLRLQLRRLGIAVNDVDSLRLSEAKAREISSYMQSFIRPLVNKVFGDDQGTAHGNGNGARPPAAEADGPIDLLALFTRSGVEQTRRNLQRLSEMLALDLGDLPGFLQDFADVYLSLAYYQACHDRNMPLIEEFLTALAAMRQAAERERNATVAGACAMVMRRFQAASEDVRSVLDMFRIRTDDMWKDLNADKFHRLQKMIIGHQVAIGATLCAITVKLNAWSGAFPRLDAGSPAARAAFLLSSIRPGIERLERIAYAD